MSDTIKELRRVAAQLPQHAELLKAAANELHHLRTRLRNREHTHSHECRHCSHAYTPKPGTNENCPACGSDGICQTQ